MTSSEVNAMLSELAQAMNWVNGACGYFVSGRGIVVESDLVYPGDSIIQNLFAQHQAAHKIVCDSMSAIYSNQKAAEAAAPAAESGATAGAVSNLTNAYDAAMAALQAGKAALNTQLDTMEAIKARIEELKAKELEDNLGSTGTPSTPGTP
ncbi:MAG: hypothetical protein GX442_20255 [Candidatus Riflebacteria bacterium]|nr:hypothetical protein [Candidatus Riflebacteria bacterium]